MSTMFIHPLTVIRSTYDDDVLDRDEAGQPSVSTTAIEATGLVQPLTSRELGELADTRSAGAEIADHRIFVPLMDLATSDVVVYDARRYHITGIRRHEYGSLQHMELLARQVTSSTDVIDVGS